MKKESKILSNASMNILKRGSTTTKQGNLKASAKTKESHKEKGNEKSGKENIISTRKSSLYLAKESNITLSTDVKTIDEQKDEIKNKFKIQKSNCTKSTINGNIDRGNGKNNEISYDDTKMFKQDEKEKWVKLDAANLKEDNMQNSYEEKESTNEMNEEQLQGKIDIRETNVKNGTQDICKGVCINGTSVTDTNRERIGREGASAEKGVEEEAEEEEHVEMQIRSSSDDMRKIPAVGEKTGHFSSSYRSYVHYEEEVGCKRETIEQDDDADRSRGESVDVQGKYEQTLYEQAPHGGAECGQVEDSEDEAGRERQREEDDAFYEQSSVYNSILKKLNIEQGEEFENSHVIILGNKDVGKSCLVKSLQQVSFQNDIDDEELLYKNESRVLPLDYACLCVKNLEEKRKIKDMKGTSHVWVLQHSSYVTSLIRNLKKFKNIKKIVILICTDLYKPYNIMSDINQWIEVVYILFEELYSSYDANKLNELKEDLESYIYNYKKEALERGRKGGENISGGEDGEVGGGGRGVARAIGGANDRDIVDYIGDVDGRSSAGEKDLFNVNRKGLVKINLTFPILFVICKSDGYEILNNRTYQGYIDVIISYLRNLALHYQAAIIFCNTVNKKELKNVQLLYKYLMHRIYNFPFNDKEIVDDYEKIFIPSGYDNKDLINESIKNTFVQNFNKPYDSIIIKPISNKSIVAEHSQNIVKENYFNDFLASISTDVSNTVEINGTNGGVMECNKESTNRYVIMNDMSNVSRECNSKNESNDKNDQSLHSFFQSLLAKGRSKSPSAPSITPLILDKKGK
ncbi:dynein light intermediate chain 2, putative [Plasmodium ovale curtisi]|uniref:Dynein light intermediate chain 2, putative n=1 Tax=Plasmodium ovale curtisi TaxID=864141 RepID=A0A1A8VQ90_PLAOA|nr:dynein light intermediate chain 2, putative [Plasmodium ovale curtisi]